MTNGSSLPAVDETDGDATGLLVCPRFPYPPTSGGVKRTLRLAQAMQRAGLGVRIMTDDRPNASAVASAKKMGIGTCVLPSFDHTSRQRIEQHLRRLPGPRSEALSAELGYHASSRGVVVQLEGVIAASHVAWGQTPPVVFSTHNVEADLARQAIARAGESRRESLRLRYHAHRVSRCEQLTAQRAAAVICVSDADADAFSRYAVRLLVAPNGVDPEFFSVQSPSVDPRAESVLFFGQFSYAPNREGIGRFVTDGWPVLAQSRPLCRLIIVGEGSDTIAIPPKYAGRIDCMGLVDDIAREVSRADLTIVPIWSGGGTRLKVLESLAAMRPVVGTRLGVSGIGFVDGRHGVVAETASGISYAAAALLGDRQRRNWMGEQGRTLAQAFAWERALAPVQRLYAGFAAKGELRVPERSTA